jgi:glutathione S-transferase
LRSFSIISIAEPVSFSHTKLQHGRRKSTYAVSTGLIRNGVLRLLTNSNNRLSSTHRSHPNGLEFRSSALSKRLTETMNTSLKRLTWVTHSQQSLSGIIVLRLRAVGGENFHPEYVKINPNGTVPSLTSASLAQPLVDTTEILEYMNKRQTGTKLVPDDPATQEKMQKIIDLVHSDQVGTNLILLQARNKEEMEKKQASMWKAFLGARQEKLEKYIQQAPEFNDYYAHRIEMNGAVHKLYNIPVGKEHEPFFEQSDSMFRDFAAGVEQLGELIVLPYAAGDKITLADLHVVPWFSHALWGAGGVEVNDFEPLEKLLQVSVPGFTIPPKIKEWWATMGKRESFKKCFPQLH